MNTCFEVADYFLKRQDPDAGDLISNMKLQKLVYYAQGFNLAINGAPLFPETIKAWDHGPVCVDLYEKYKEFEGKPLPVPIPYGVDTNALFDEDTRKILDMVYTYYGQFSAWKLRNLTHEEDPWIVAYHKGRSEISHESMRIYFKTQLLESDDN